MGLSNTIMSLFEEYHNSPVIIAAVATTTLVLCVPLLMKWTQKPKQFKKDRIILCAFAKKENFPSPSGFCEKIETYLRATSTPYEHFVTFPNTSPKGKLPYIIDGDQVIPDSHFIIQHLIQTKKSRDMNVNLTRVQLADSRAFQAYLEEFIYPCIVWERWCNDKNFKVLSSEIFGSIPWLIRFPLSRYFRRNVQKTLWAQGIARHSIEEIQSRLTTAADDLEAKINNKTLSFHGTQELTEIDVIIFAFLVTTLGTGANPIFHDLILQRPTLIAFTSRIINQLFPEYKQIIQKLEGAKRLS